MSQHKVDTLNHRATHFQVVLGFDRPLQSYFLRVHRTDRLGREALLYDSLRDGEADLNDYRRFLSKGLKLEMPPALWEELQQEAAGGRATNRVGFWDVIAKKFEILDLDSGQRCTVDSGLQ